MDCKEGYYNHTNSGEGCIYWMCRCGHDFGEHSDGLRIINDEIIEMACLCGCKGREFYSYGECKVECLFKLKIKEVEKEND